MGELSGILSLNKPAGITSFRALSVVKRLLPRGTKVGHAGTLDSFATGVLLLLIGKATRQCERLMGEPKQYQATLRLGATTATDDPESPAVPYPDAVLPSREQFLAALPKFRGTIQQVPPAYSALKIGGRRASDRVRQGQAIPMTARPVRIDAIELLDFSPPNARLRIDCGRGTYIRAIARDLGSDLRCGGYLIELCRTRIGPFDVAGAARLESLSEPMIQAHLTQL